MRLAIGIMVETILYSIEFVDNTIAAYPALSAPGDSQKQC